MIVVEWEIERCGFAPTGAVIGFEHELAFEHDVADGVYREMQMSAFRF